LAGEGLLFTADADVSTTKEEGGVRMKYEEEASILLHFLILLKTLKVKQVLISCLHLPRQKWSLATEPNRVTFMPRLEEVELANCICRSAEHGHAYDTWNLEAISIVKIVEI
jgi:hypothetical protein